MNVYLISSAYAGCSYVRILLPAYHNGFDTDTEEVLKGASKNPLYLKNKLAGADVVVFHRPENEEYYKLAELLKADGKKIVLDNDDTFKMSYHPLAQFTPDAVEVELKKRANSIDKFLEIADLATTTTKTLAKEYKKINKNTVILPNCVDKFDWEKPLRNKGNKVRIGMVGSVALEYDYRHLKGVLRKLSKRDDVELVLFGLGSKAHRKVNPKVTEAFKDDYAFWNTIEKEHFPWCQMKDYPRTLNEARLDIMLIPRKNNYFNKCKSNVKFLEASMCEIPVIAQSFKDGPYEELSHLENGVLIKDNKDWMKYIDMLVSDKELRRKIGKNAKKYTLKNYNIEDKAHLWAEAYEKLYEN